MLAAFRHPSTPPDPMTDKDEPLPASAYIALEEGHYLATRLTRGPWHPEHQHAGPPIAIACRAIEHAAHHHGLAHVSRLTANLLRPVPIGELAIEVASDYVGRNAGHFSARVLSGVKEVARLTALVQREGALALPDDLPVHAEATPPPGPDESPPVHFPFAGRHVGYSDLVETRLARGSFWRGPCTVWFRLRHPLLDSEPTGVYQRVAVAADSGNGVSAVLDLARYAFVNSDLTINLLRRPHGEWIALDARTHLGADGCGLAVSSLFDTHGLIGVATQSLAIRARDGAAAPHAPQRPQGQAHGDG